MGGVFPMMKQWMAAATFLSLASFAATSHASTILCTVIADGTSGKILKQQGNCETRRTTLTRSCAPVCALAPISCGSFPACWIRSRRGACGAADQRSARTMVA